MARQFQNAKHLGAGSDYTDYELDLWINEVYKEFCNKTELLVKNVDLTLTSGVAYFPETVVDVKFVSYEDEQLDSINRYALNQHPAI
jgi:hypothetical protein